ncbi:MAG TPA: hypothetical protein VM101_12310, partial [Flavitalea sp.]|nr:hypothetical protein [Flavitalea sp.]
MRFFTLLVLLFIGLGSSAQSFNYHCSRDTTVVGCSNSCITLKAIVPDIHSSTSTYVMVPGNSPSNSCMMAPPVLPNGPGTPTNLTIDDRYSTAINIGFPFSFFGTTYNQLVASTNGLLSFDLTLANAFSHYGILDQGGFLSAIGGTPLNLPSALYDKALIMGPYHDLNPALTTSPTQRIQYTTVGTAPHRKWVLSFYRVPLFNCNTLIENTHQIVLHESTSIVEVLIFNKQICTTWNEGRAMIGMQDMNRTAAIMVPGRRASDPAWSVTGNNVNAVESYQFIPSGASTLFKRVELYDLTGNLVSVGSTSNLNNGNLEASFTNICTQLGVTTFVVKSVYAKNDNPAVEVFGTDTIRVNKTGGILNAVPAVTASGCGAPSGLISMNISAGVAPYQFALNGGTYQTSNQFTGLTRGTYIITVKDAPGCTYNYTTTVGLNNTLKVNAL